MKNLLLDKNGLFLNSKKIVFEDRYTRNKYLVIGICLIIVVLLGAIDYLTGYEISFSIFYLIPISISVYYFGFNLGLIFSLLSAIIWYFADIYSGHEYQHFLIPIWNATMRFGYFILHTFIMNKFIDSYKKAKTESLTDSLTGLLNSRFFYILFERELSRAKRTNKPFTLVYFDLDNFKLMNDTFGHLSGDSLLIMISGLIKANIRPSDIFARMGGDEFVLLFPETDYNLSKEIIKRIKDLVTIEIMKNNWAVTLSVGAITFRRFNYNVDEMIKLVDDLMYNVKKNGKNNIEHHLYE
ncbi:MAG: GGDEF domain-containing protein [candidate division WOR-3 bacterium]